MKKFILVIFVWLTLPSFAFGDAELARSYASDAETHAGEASTAATKASTAETLDECHTYAKKAMDAAADAEAAASSAQSQLNH